ncbi:MAG TPA: asparagine synthase-related protein [Thermoanaerobaculia bacterium]|nr:asparagine synthase-related protein [Thermoanaerobaculia bacterium]
MGALFANLRLDGAPGPRDLAAFFGASAEPPGDGDSVRSWEWATLGCRAFHSTPEEAGESQPLVDPSGRFALLFDGRLDNREELGVSSEESDAAAVLRFLAGGKWEALDRFIGPWVLLFLDLREREVHLARDPTGERMLCWHATAERLLVASEPAVLLRDPGDLDEATLAAFFALREPAPDATFFRAVKQVPPGWRVTFSAAGERRHSFWNPDLSLLRGSEADSVEAFRELLSTAVRAQLRSTGPATVLMSGGLDSTTVAAHAVLAGGQGKVRAVSWRFRELTEADESRFAQAMMTAAGLEPAWVDGDGCWPLRDLDKTAIDPSLPFENPYRELHAAAFSAAAAGGSRALLTGHFSDEMYHGVDAWWLRDCLTRGRAAAARRGLRDELRWRSRPEVWTPGLRRALGVLLLGSAWERLRSVRTPSWLIPSARKSLEYRPVRARHPEQAQTLLAPFAMMGIAVEMRRARHHGVELRFPFRDRRLIELALRLPADHLARPGWRKRLVWLAADGYLPDAVRLRRQMSDLGPLFARGIGEREHETVRRLLFGEGPQLWRRWVDPALLERFLDTARTGGSGVPTLVFWHCLAAELWARSLVQ